MTYARAYQALTTLEDLTDEIAAALEAAAAALNSVLRPPPAPVIPAPAMTMAASAVAVPDPVNEHPGPDFAPPRF